MAVRGGGGRLAASVDFVAAYTREGAWLGTSQSGTAADFVASSDEVKRRCSLRTARIAGQHAREPGPSRCWRGRVERHRESARTAAANRGRALQGDRD